MMKITSLNAFKCKSNLECYSTACCKDKICVDSSECKKTIDIIYYSIEGLVAFFIFIILFC